MNKTIIILSVILFTFMIGSSIFADDCKGAKKSNLESKDYQSCLEFLYPKDKDYVSYPMYYNEQQAETAKERDRALRRAEKSTGPNDKVRQAWNYMEDLLYPEDKAIFW